MTTEIYRGPERRMNADERYDTRLAKLEAQFAAHDGICGERYRNLEASISGNKDAVGKIYTLLWSVASALILLLITATVSLFNQLYVIKHAVGIIK